MKTMNLCIIFTFFFLCCTVHGQFELFPTSQSNDILQPSDIAETASTMANPKTEKAQYTAYFPIEVVLNAVIVPLNESYLNTSSNANKIPIEKMTGLVNIMRSLTFRVPIVVPMVNQTLIQLTVMTVRDEAQTVNIKLNRMRILEFGKVNDQTLKLTEDEVTPMRVSVDVE